jgi:hypothetical protein
LPKPNGNTDSSGYEPQSPPNIALSYTNAMVFATVKFVITNRELGRLAEVIALQGVKSALMKAIAERQSELAEQTEIFRFGLHESGTVYVASDSSTGARLVHSQSSKSVTMTLNSNPLSPAAATAVSCAAFSAMSVFWIA